MASSPYSKLARPASSDARSIVGSRTNFVDRPDLVTQRFVAIGGMLLLILGFLLWMTGLATSPGPSECRIFPQVLEFAPRLNATIRVRGNTSCRIPIVARSGSVEDLQLSVLPDSGVVTLNPDGVSYRPSPGFRGLDFFAFSLRGRSALFAGTSVARVYVFVK